jgi:hypothetical protein
MKSKRLLLSLAIAIGLLSAPSTQAGDLAFHDRF